MAEEAKHMPTVNDQYQRLIEARNFHYDNFNKWLMSFYVIIGALFIAFYSVKNDYQVIVAIMGYVVSLAAWLSGKGYFYWENKWIEKIHHFEKNILKYTDDMQVYSYLVDQHKHDEPYNPIKGANVSTTKVTLFMTALITVAWGFLIMMLLLKDSASYRELIAITTSLVVSYALMFFGTRILPSVEKKDELTASNKTRKKK